jgi:cell division protein FtsX
MVKESKKDKVKEGAKAKKEKPIEEMTVKELREIAKGIPGITGVSSMKKEQLLEAIRNAKEEEVKKEEAKAKKAEREVPKEEKAEEEEPEKIDAKEKEEEVKKPEEIEAKEKPLDKMTAKELREVAGEIPGAEGVQAMKKEQLLEVIKKARGIKEEAPEEKREKRGVEKDPRIRELKQKIIVLQQEKEAARAARDRKKLDVLRRRINRLKKRTRKVAQAA